MLLHKKIIIILDFNILLSSLRPCRILVKRIIDKAKHIYHVLYGLIGLPIIKFHIIVDFITTLKIKIFI